MNTDSKDLIYQFDDEAIVEGFLEGETRTHEWGELYRALTTRLELAREQGDLARLKEIEQQLAALAQEEAITQFVEDAVRVTLRRAPQAELVDEFEIF